MAVNYSKNPKSFLWDGNGLASFQTPADTTLTYEPFFGLEEKPFSLNADARFVYESPTYSATRESLIAGIRRREGLLVLTGEIGTGKTTLCRTVLRELGRKTYSSIVPDPFASREDLLKMLLIDFGVLSIQELTDGRWQQASRTELGYVLWEFLDSVARDAFVVVIIDEAQNMSLPLIEETRILSDTLGAQGLLQIVFVGQPELHGKLKLPEMRQVDQRVCGYHRLAPMSREAVEGYITHRLRAAGFRSDRVLFPPDVVDRLHRRCGGVPRLVNRVCDRALHLACGQRAEAVDQEILEAALFEVGATTLSPTWDSIIFAEPPASPPVVVATVPKPASTSEPAAGVVKTVTLLACDDVFLSEATLEKETDHSAERNLEPPSRTLTPAPVADVAPLRSVSTTAPRPVAPARHVGTEWLQGFREIDEPRLWRTWAKQTAIGAVLAAVSLVFVGASVLVDSQAPLTLPALPEAPAKVVPGIVVIDDPPSDLPVTDAPLTEVAPTEPPVALLSAATGQ